MMNHLAFRLAYDNQTSAAQKVYDAVPIIESWSQAQIIAEMNRVGVSLEYRVMGGCLNNLVRSGLIQEVIKGYFRRLPVRPAPTQQPKPVAPIESKKEEIMTQAMPAAKPAVKQSPLEILASLATRAKELTADIENAALAIQDQLEATEKDMEKFRQLQALLKGMGA